MLSNVALLYYGEGLTQGEIARRMQVSRATIVNMLKDCRDLGIVDIRVEGRHLKGSTLSRELRDKFDLQDVYVAQYGEVLPELSRKDLLPHLARVASTAVTDVILPGDRVGIAWGETMISVADAMPHRSVSNVEVCQLIGSMISERIVASENCTIQIAHRLGARSYTLHAPSLISTAELADRLRAEPTICTQLERLRSLDMTIASVGNVEPETHLVAAGIATAQELEDARAAGAVGVICCRYLDVDGQEVEMPPNDRLVAADIRDLRAARKRLLAVCGLDRAAATLAAIRGGLVTHLCVDQFLGKALIDA